MKTRISNLIDHCGLSDIRNSYDKHIRFWSKFSMVSIIIWNQFYGCWKNLKVTIKSITINLKIYQILLKEIRFIVIRARNENYNVLSYDCGDSVYFLKFFQISQRWYQIERKKIVSDQVKNTCFFFQFWMIKAGIY